MNFRDIFSCSVFKAAEREKIPGAWHSQRKSAEGVLRSDPRQHVHLQRLVLILPFLHSANCFEENRTGERYINCARSTLKAVKRQHIDRKRPRIRIPTDAIITNLLEAFSSVTHQSMMLENVKI